MAEDSHEVVRSLRATIRADRYQQLADIARLEDRSLSAEVRRAVDEHIARRMMKPGDVVPERNYETGCSDE